MGSLLPAVLKVIRVTIINSWLLVGATICFWLIALIVNFYKPAVWLFGLAWNVCVVLIGGALGSFLLHEVGHVVALLAPSGTCSVQIERTWLRLSIYPLDPLSTRRMVVAALAGPGSAAVIGAGLLILGHPIGWFYVLHLVFLLPCFGDGRALVSARQRVIQKR